MPVYFDTLKNVIDRVQILSIKDCLRISFEEKLHLRDCQYNNIALLSELRYRYIKALYT